MQQENSGTYYKHIPYSDSLFPYKFNTGSKWIYRKVGSTNIDEVTLVNSAPSTCERTPCHILSSASDTCIITDIYNMTFYSSFYNRTDLLSLHGMYFSSLGDWCSDHPIFSANFMPVDTLYKLYLLDSHLTLNIDTNSFTSVIKMQCKGDAAGVIMHSPKNNVIIYMCPNIGIVKKEIELSSGNMETWELFSYSIKK
ncbi:MAG: hypothetical protein IPP32_07210 [Bacteroidetes bacterium]|nr:hypothetical protein [Bacteroidota bacterium]